MGRSALILLIVLSAPWTVGMFAAALQVPVWITAVAVLPAYVVLFDVIQP